MKVHIVWMDGEERDYKAESARVWESVLVLLNAHLDGRLHKRVNIPVANIRAWTDES